MEIGVLVPRSGEVGFGLNLGYDNPRGSDIGLNLLFRGKNFGGELGFGYVDGVLDGNRGVGCLSDRVV